ncbi:response regulator transcription factor [Campylobacter fetus]|uniref:Transcriptional activator protein CopR n=2 Tax=Campylobacter fetus TaxID=196 RepID=A0RP82_CAMFF|nr:response regulator transcription factor [Campylobacter fetus]ABK81737.1 transcriptional activator protein CopR [Campylobacter fetus subsp. fetus 82-40]EAI3886078.1 response regulator transcription factor [Campylobacter fetus]EAI3915156.1 response regulator transcription factor [Campylobacter fetus]EAI3918791.1 response regulator transcription factor [Campylobacter fetus]EAI8859396.1 response regulator transcription factor [Campylobacter fetus]
MSKILVLEDEPMLQDMISSYLQSFGYEVEASDSYDKALSIAYEKNFDLFIFDVKIIGGSGFELLDELRSSGVATPCIFATSLNGINDVTKGFKVGCDDYIKKPFELAELLLRVQNILKRNFNHYVDDNFIIINSNFKFDILQKKLMQDGKVLPLAKKETELLCLFLKNKNRILSRDEIYSQIWEFYEVPSELSLRVYIRNLRKLIGNEKIISHSKLGYEYVS